jgi:hypothetical protein
VRHGKSTQETGDQNGDESETITRGRTQAAARRPSPGSSPDYSYLFEDSRDSNQQVESYTPRGSPPRQSGDECVDGNQAQVEALDTGEQERGHNETC